jgi:hypothetical protein
MVFENLGKNSLKEAVTLFVNNIKKSSKSSLANNTAMLTRSAQLFGVFWRILILISTVNTIPEIGSENVKFEPAVEPEPSKSIE